MARNRYYHCHWTFLVFAWPLEISTVLKSHWQSPYTVLTVGKCLPLGLCRGTGKRLITYGQMYSSENHLCKPPRLPHDLTYDRHIHPCASGNALADVFYFVSFGNMWFLGDVISSPKCVGWWELFHMKFHITLDNIYLHWDKPEYFGSMRPEKCIVFNACSLHMLWNILLAYTQTGLNLDYPLKTRHEFPIEVCLACM